MKRVVAALVIGVSLNGAASAAAQGRFVNLPTTVDGRTGAAALWIPVDYDPGRQWPLVVYLHGGAERGDHGADATGTWLNDIPLVQVMRKDPGRVPGLVLIPRCPRDTVWVRHPSTEVVPECCRSFARLPGAYPAVDAALEAAAKTYAVDPDRIVLTGGSLGAYGSLRYGAMHRERFAGILAVAGFSPLGDATALARLPLWVFHGDADTTIPISLARATVDAVRKAAGNVQLTELPGMGHTADVGMLVYGRPDVMSWLFSQRRTAK